MGNESWHTSLLHQIANTLSLNDKKKVQICTKCGVTFSGRDNWKNHMLSVHEGKKPYTCEFCDGGFQANQVDYLYVVECVFIF